MPEKDPFVPRWNSYAAIALVAMAVLSLEVVSMRIFAVESTSSFGYMILSVALLGFGFSGALLAVFSRTFTRATEAWLRRSALAFPVAVALSTVLWKQVPFIPQKILQDVSQAGFIALLYLLQFLPFFVGSFFIGLLLVAAKDKVGRLYAADLIGSGVGGLLTLGAFFLLAPEHLPLYVMALGFLGWLLLIWPERRLRTVRAMALPAVLMVGSVAIVLFFGGLNVSEYKGISYALSTAEVTGARVIHTTYGPLGTIEVVESTSERSAPGLSSAAPGDALPPNQHGIYLDGNRISSVSRDLTEDEGAYLDWLLTSIAYELRGRARVLQIGLGGGAGVREALHHGAKEIVVAEIDSHFVHMLKTTFAEYTGNLLEEPGVDVRLRGGRDLARVMPGRFDLVMLSLVDAGGISFPGAKSIAENYLVTVEALREYIRALDQGGLLAVQMRLQEPPRASLRLLPSVVRACREELGDEACRQGLVMVRGELYGLLLLARDGFNAEHLDLTRALAFEKGFKLAWEPGMGRDSLEAEQEAEAAFWADLQDSQGIDLTAFDTDGPVQDPYFDCLSALLTGAPEDGQRYLADYPFNITPTTDDRPYFQALLKSGSLDFLKKSAYDPAHWTREIPPDLWSEPLLMVTLVQSLLFGLLILLVPLLRRRSGLGRGARLRTLIYFAMLGLNFMLIEMVMMQWLTLFLAAPLYSASLVLAVLLVASGLGSGFSVRFVGRGRQGLTIAVAGVALFTILYIVGLNPLLNALLFLPLPARIPVAAVVLFPLGFCLGMPFPLGMSELSMRNRPSLVAWGWGINGAVSVSAIILAQILAIRIGFTLVMTIAVLGYVVAWLAWPGAAPREVAGSDGA